MRSTESETPTRPDEEPEFEQVDALFDRLLDATEDERRAVLADESLDPALRTRVRRLLALSDDPPPRLNEPVVGSGATEVLGEAPLLRSVGPYTIRGVVGVGAMGVVYRAEQQTPRREVALKLMRATVEGEAGTRRFLREAEFLGRLQHPGIAQIFESGTARLEEGTTAYIAMELVDGRPLGEYADAAGLPLDARVGLLAELCDAVHHAHLRGVVHRDLKPNNVLVTGDGAVKVIDFGVARAVDPDGDGRATLDRTLPGQVVGTLAYMSPEQVQGRTEAIDARTDVYSLGVLGFELLSGTLPHDLEGTTLAEGARRIVERPARRLGAVAPECRGDLDAIVDRALEKEPERRFQSASAFADDLRRFLAGEAVQSRPASTLYLLRRLAARHRALVIGSAMTLAALTVGLIGTGWGLVTARRANRELEHSNRQLTELNEDLERVAGFQEDQLSSLDVLELAASLRHSTLEQTPAQERERVEHALASVNFVDVAQESLEANLFRPSLESIGRSFADQALVRAQLLQALANTALTLGLLDLAREAGEQALALRRAELGGDAPQTLASLLRTSEVLRGVGEYDESEERIRECIAGRARLFGPDDPRTLAATSHLAATLQHLDRLDEAEELFRAVLEGNRRALGEDDPHTRRSALNLGSVLVRKGRFEEAEPLMSAALEWRLSALGPNHADTLSAKEALSKVLDELGRFDVAVRHARDVYEVRRSTLGNRHPDTALAMDRLGSLLQRSGRRDEAGELFREALASQRGSLGEDHPLTLIALARLADWEFDSGDVLEAEAMYRSSWEGLKHALGPDHSHTMRSASRLGQALGWLGRYEEAEPLYRTTLANSRATLGERHPSTLTCLANLGLLLVDLGRLDEAAVVLREALDARAEVLGPVHPSTLNSYYNLAHLLHTQGELEQAKPLLRYALEHYTESLGPDSDGALFSAGKLAQVLLEDGEHEEAERLFRDLYERRRALFDEAHPGTLAVLDGLVAALEARARWDESEDLLLAHRERCAGDPALEARARSRLAEHYGARHAAQPGQGHDARAEAWR